MNPIFYLDEIDKISGSSEKNNAAVSNVLLHLLDNSQNHEFKDNYFSDDITFDLSKVFWIASFNDPQLLDPILKNRINIIQIPELLVSDKVQVVKGISYPETLKRINKQPADFVFPDSVIEYIIRQTKEEPGMRLIENNIDKIFTKINTTLILKCVQFDKNLYVYEKLSRLIQGQGPVTITTEIVDAVLGNPREHQPWMNMYS
jgi:ATP-dependent Lon protease